MSTVLRVRDLAVEFRAPEGVIRAVDGVSFVVPQGRTVALVGESGSGKTVVSQAIMRILPKAARIAGGEILFFDPDSPGTFVDVTKLGVDSKEMRALRGGRISIIFQEPMTSLSPLHTIGDQISETVLLHRRTSRAEAVKLTVEMLRLVGFAEPGQAVHTYPFEL
ncbi:MAG TPA: ATP-binding cassette domain-containing protein, partial [Alphaproteobacteria bacterium]|nr:ATP-binding cassette domain-containing protein [Alphaproteobacteria bacterium]